MIATGTDVEIGFQSGPGVNRAATGTLQGIGDGDFTSQHDSLLPGNHRSQRAGEQKTAARLSQVPQPPLD